MWHPSTTCRNWRFNQTKLEDRVCFLHVCDMHVLADEFQFMCQCPLYDEERNTMFNHMSSKYPNFNDLCEEDKFISIMSCDCFNKVA